MVVDSGVHPSLHPNGHNDIVFAKFNPKNYCSPHHYHEVCHYQDANIDHTKRAIDLFDWEKAHTNTPVNEKVAIFRRLFSITTFHTQRPGNYSICLSGKIILATIFVMKTNEVLGY